MKFIQEENKGWEVATSGVVANKTLSEILLNPGDSKEIELVLTWDNSTGEVGTISNYAEISEVYVENGNDDIDSMPGNFRGTAVEDDETKMEVMITIYTGFTAIRKMFIAGLIGILIMLAGAIYIQKRK